MLRVARPQEAAAGHGAYRANPYQDHYSQAAPPEEFVDFTDGEHGYNAETRWEALAKTGYLTPNDHFIRSHAPPPL